MRKKIVLIFLFLILLTGCSLKKIVVKEDILEGKWKIAATTEETQAMWKFKGKEFWFYKSHTDLKDNYWYGAISTKSGQDALDEAGITDEEFERTMSSQNIKKENVYLITCYPTKIISNGEDKSATNIPENASWQLLWVIIDSDKSNIRAQYVNLSTYQTGEYVKIK